MRRLSILDDVSKPSSDALDVGLSPVGDVISGVNGFIGGVGSGMRPPGGSKRSSGGLPVGAILDCGGAMLGIGGCPFWGR